MSVPTAAGAAKSSSTSGRKTVALIGNPNTGKSTLFNALSGLKARTGNYPGVTVEKKIGRVVWNEREIDLVDLPGTYSLSPRSLDEKVSVDVLLGRQSGIPPVDAVVCILDASNLERNLYLASQVLDLGLPTVLVLNMIDVARERGVVCDAAKLSARLGVPVVTSEAHRRVNLAEIKQAIAVAADAPTRTPENLFPAEFVQAAEELRATVRSARGDDLPPFLAQRLLLDRGGQLELELADSSAAGQTVARALEAARQRLAERNLRVPAVEARLRYAWAREVLAGVLTRPVSRVVTASDRIDKVLTHKVGGLIVFAALMFLIFQTIYTWAGPLMDFVDGIQGSIADWITGRMNPGPLRSLIVDGVIAGVGGVLIFLPQICLLFLFLAVLEDCGYMARAAFLMDKLMSKLGLSGKSFVPMMSSFACAIPGVMSTRTIENRKDRMVTLLVAPLMSCSARLPVYLLLIVAFIPETTLFQWGSFSLFGSQYSMIHLGLQGLVLFAMYSVGVLVAIPVAWTLKKTFFKGETPPFVMELPSYKIPSFRVVFDRVYDRGKAFVVRAGTLIFATSILVWGAGYFPGDHTEQHQLQRTMESMEDVQASREADVKEAELIATVFERMQKGEEITEAEERLFRRTMGVPDDEPLKPDAPEVTRFAKQYLAQQQDRLEQIRVQLDQLQSESNHVNANLIANSYLGRMGHAIEPVVKPLGWDWKIGVGAIASFPAREVIIATLGTIYSLGGDVSEEDEGLIGAIKSAEWPDGTKVFNIPVALSVMVFFALCAQCAATLMVIKRETNSWRWPAFTFVYMTTLAYLGALATYQIGRLWL